MDDVSSALEQVRKNAAPGYELAYAEARRALDGQERALTAFRTRAGLVLSAAAIITSFLGGQALTQHGFTTLSWVAIGAFAVLGMAALCVLWPDDDWQFEAIPNQVISALGIPAGSPRARIGSRDLAERAGDREVDWCPRWRRPSPHLRRLRSRSRSSRAR